MPRRYRLSLPLWCPQGGLPSLSPAYPAFSFLFCPLSPRPPSPVGKGGLRLFSCKGFRPLHPRHLTACGTYRACQAGTRRGACLPCCPPPPPLACFPSPYLPAPLPRRGRGRFFCFLMQGAPSLASPAFNRLRHLQRLSSRCPTQREVHGLPPEWQEMLSLEQCRQPRRGGTGGDGTIRRKRRRRLRWSSPPGQSEPVPQGFSPLRVRRRQGKQATKKASHTCGYR